MSAPVDRPGCLFCGALRTGPGHYLVCDGRQGAVEAAGADFDPLLIAGVVPETWTTSQAAAVRNDAETRERQRGEVFAAIRAAGARGATDDELQQALGLEGNSERPRRWELWKRDRIAMLRDGEGGVVRRLTRMRRQAVVWICVDLS